MTEDHQNVSGVTTNLGLSLRGHSILKGLKESGEFHEMADAYRLGAALAISLHITPPALEDKTTVFGVHTIDPNGKLKTTVEIAYADSEMPPYRLIELLADWGVKEIERRLSTGTLDLSDVEEGEP